MCIMWFPKFGHDSYWMTIWSLIVTQTIWHIVNYWYIGTQQLVMPFILPIMLWWIHHKFFYLLPMLKFCSIFIPQVSNEFTLYGLMASGWSTNYKSSHACSKTYLNTTVDYLVILLDLSTVLLEYINPFLWSIAKIIQPNMIASCSMLSGTYYAQIMWLIAYIYYFNLPNTFSVTISLIITDSPLITTVHWNCWSSLVVFNCVIV